MPQYLFCYDIADDARLRRVAAIAEQHGVRLQYSVFLVRTTRAGLARLVHALEEVIHPQEDDIRIYPLPAEPVWEHYGTALWPEGIFMSGQWPEEPHDGDDDDEGEPDAAGEVGKENPPRSGG